MTKQQLEKKIARAVDRALEKAAQFADREMASERSTFDPEEWLYLRPAVQRIASGIRRMKSTAAAWPDSVIGRLHLAEQKDLPLGLSQEDVAEVMRYVRARPPAGPIILPPEFKTTVQRELKTVRAQITLNQHRAAKRAERMVTSKRGAR